MFSSKNETKNIPKNYAKAFLRYIIDKKQIVFIKNILRNIHCDVEYLEIVKFAKEFKKNMNAIKDVRNIWFDCSSEKMKIVTKLMRIVSY